MISVISVMVAVLVLKAACVAGFWSSTTEVPVVSVPITAQGALFSSWSDEGGPGVGTGVGTGSASGSASGSAGDDGDADRSCLWWKGTHYYDVDVGMCNAFSITRVASGDVAHAIERASYCAVQGATDCVLNGEIGFSIPSVFLYDQDTAEMRMLIAPRYLGHDEPGPVKTIKMQDPMGAHANQLFELNSTLKIEYLVGGARTMGTEFLTGQAAYCVQSLRRSIAPACWDALD